MLGTVRPDLEDKLSCKNLSGASSPSWTVKAKGLLFLLRPMLLVLSHWPALILFIYLFLSKTVSQIQVSFWLPSQNRHPVNERERLRAGEKKFELCFTRGVISLCFVWGVPPACASWHISGEEDDEAYFFVTYYISCCSAKLMYSD